MSDDKCENGCVLPLRFPRRPGENLPSVHGVVCFCSTPDARISSDNRPALNGPVAAVNTVGRIGHGRGRPRSVGHDLRALLRCEVQQRLAGSQRTAAQQQQRRGALHGDITAASRSAAASVAHPALARPAAAPSARSCATAGLRRATCHPRARGSSAGSSCRGGARAWLHPPA